MVHGTVPVCVAHQQHLKGQKKKKRRGRPRVDARARAVSVSEPSLIMIFKAFYISGTTLAQPRRFQR